MCSNRNFASITAHQRNMEYFTTYLLLELLFTHVSVDSIHRSCQQPRHHLPKWSEWVSAQRLQALGPLHYIWFFKSDGSWRPCGDYRRLNLITEPDHYPMPNIIDITNNIGKSRVFSKLHLLKGYFQVPVHPPDVPKTAIVTPFGNYVFHYSTFGLRNSGATFQRMMNSIFGHLPNVVVYIDDMLIFSEDIHQHEQHLRQVLSLLQQNGLIVRQDKCVFAAPVVEFLGHEISGDGIRPLSSKVKAIQDYPTPTTIKELQTFLGMVNYYHRFLPMAASKMASLYNVLAKKNLKAYYGILNNIQPLSKQNRPWLMQRLCATPCLAPHSYLLPMPVTLLSGRSWRC